VAGQQDVEQDGEGSAVGFAAVGQALPAVVSDHLRSHVAWGPHEGLQLAGGVPVLQSVTLILAVGPAVSSRMFSILMLRWLTHQLCRKATACAVW
jgi:hypothetical protein